MTTPQPGAVEDDVVASSARGAAEALARLLRTTVLSGGGVTVASPSVVTDLYGQRLVAIAFRTSGPVDGTVVLVGDEGAALMLAVGLLGGSSEALTPRHLDVLQEVGNIVASAYLNGLARAFGKTCLPSVPALVLGDAAKVWADALAGPGDARLVQIELERGGLRMGLLVAP